MAEANFDNDARVTVPFGSFLGYALGASLFTKVADPFALLMSLVIGFAVGYALRKFVGDKKLVAEIASFFMAVVWFIFGAMGTFT